MTRVTVPDVSAAAQLACLLEASAAKPGNVSPGCHFADARYEDFLASAAAIGRPFANAGARSLGATVRSAIDANVWLDAIEHKSWDRASAGAHCTSGCAGAARICGRRSAKC